MKSLFDFIVEPLNGKYDTEIKVDDKSLITMLILRILEQLVIWLKS